MSERILDCQGLPCPQPVLKCKDVVESQHPKCFSILVDNQAALENVSRFLMSRGYKCSSQKNPQGLDIIMAMLQGETTTQNSDPEISCEVAQNIRPRKTLIFIGSNLIGSGDKGLGAKLMKNFLATLGEMENLWRIILVNSGVEMAVTESAAFADLKKLEQSGVSILVCGTCLTHFGLLEKKAVGETTNMLDVVTSLHVAEKIISM